MIRQSVLALTMFAAAPALAAEPKTEAAVIAADHSWLDFEVSGNANGLDQLLAPGYVSVSPDGKVTTKEQLVSKARGRDKAASAKLAAQVAEWKAAHPTRADVTIVGDTAVLKWMMVKPTGGDPVSSSDIFVYQGGRWRAVYSQHTSASS